MWFQRYFNQAARTDRLEARDDHLSLLIAGLFGEAGSISAEAKKAQREGPAYPAYRRRLAEELGDFLWYFVRLAETSGCQPSDFGADQPAASQSGDLVARSLALGRSVGAVLGSGGAPTIEDLRAVWGCLRDVAQKADISLEEAADQNIAKVQSRWPAEKNPHYLFDENVPAEDQLPRALTIEFIERGEAGSESVLMRYGVVGVGDRITDNITDPDGYRFHDVFHMAHAAFLGWSPVVRSLLRCKRKCDPRLDRDQDGARAVIVEESVSAMVFARAKEMDFFSDVNQVDYDLLKAIQTHVAGYEVDDVPLWQWEEAILEGFRVFRQVRAAAGGLVSWDLRERTLHWQPRSSI